MNARRTQRLGHVLCVRFMRPGAHCSDVLSAVCCAQFSITKCVPMNWMENRRREIWTFRSPIVGTSANFPGLMCVCVCVCASAYRAFEWVLFSELHFICWPFSVHSCGELRRASFNHLPCLWSVLIGLIQLFLCFFPFLPFHGLHVDVVTGIVVAVVSENGPKTTALSGGTQVKAQSLRPFLSAWAAAACFVAETP